MERRTFGNTDMSVSVLGFGGAEIGFEGADEASVERLIGGALDAGLNVIDTAECYKTSEELIGKTVGHRRSEYYLFTKCGHAADGLQGPDWSPDLLAASIERSLKRLRTDYVDIIHLHSCSEEQLRQGDVIDVLMRAKEQGKTRYIGYSGDHRAALYAIQCGAFDSLETSINVADQEAIELTLPEARERNMGVIAKRPIANTAWRYDALPENGYHQAYWERLRKLDLDVLKGSMPEAVSYALRFTLAQPGVHTAIVGTAKPGRWVENATLLREGPLPAEVVQAIRERWKTVAAVDWIGQG